MAPRADLDNMEKRKILFYGIRTPTPLWREGKIIQSLKLALFMFV
jgi:hypothetical protein